MIDFPRFLGEKGGFRARNGLKWMDLAALACFHAFEVETEDAGCRGDGRKLYEELLKASRPCKLVIGAGPAHA